VARVTVDPPPNQPQTISFTGLAPVSYAPGLTVPLTAVASSGLPVSFSVISGPGSISGNSLNVIGAGSIVVSASQSGNANYSTASTITQTLIVNQGGQVISFSSLAGVEFVPGLTVFFTATASSGLPVGIEIVDGPGSITGNQLRITGVGTIQLKASQGGNANYLAALAVVRSLSVQKGAQNISFNPPSSVPFVSPLAILLEATSSSGLPVLFQVESGPAKLSGSVLSVQSVGTIVVTAIQGGDSTYQAATPISRSIVIQGKDQTITFDSPGSTTFSPGKVISLAATASSGLPVTFAVNSGPGIVTGNLLTITGAGSIEIAATQNGDVTYSAAAPLMRTVVVAKAAQSITFDLGASLALGSTPIQLKAAASSSLPVAFDLQDGAGVVDGNRLIVFGMGTLVITANQPGDSNYLPAIQIVRSVPVLPGIVLNNTAETGTIGMSLMIFVDQGVSAQVEEATVLGSWKTIDTINGQGGDAPVNVPLLPSSNGTISRFWRVRTIQ
jgi:hypothetical protein